MGAHHRARGGNFQIWSPMGPMGPHMGPMGPHGEPMGPMGPQIQNFPPGRAPGARGGKFFNFPPHRANPKIYSNSLRSIFQPRPYDF